MFYKLQIYIFELNYGWHIELCEQNFGVCLNFLFVLIKLPHFILNSQRFNNRFNLSTKLFVKKHQIPIGFKNKLNFVQHLQKKRIKGSSNINSNSNMSKIQSEQSEGQTGITHNVIFSSNSCRALRWRFISFCNDKAKN